MFKLIIRHPIIFTLCGFMIYFPQKAKAWGPEGHTIIVKLAMQFLNPDVRQNVLAVLDGMPVDTAANYFLIFIKLLRPDYSHKIFGDAAR